MSILKDVTTAVVLLCLMPLVAEAREAAGSYPRKDKSLTELENRIEETDNALEQLAHYTLRGGVGAIGYRSPFRTDSQRQESITISWGKEEPIDEIIIVPVISRAEVNHYQAEGFPLEFRVLCGSSDSTNGTEIASFSESDRLLPRIAPLIVPCAGAITASWVRVETSILSHGLFDERYIFQLSEIMVFNGDKNVALRGKVSVPTGRQPSGPWSHKALVDGFTPYLMDSAQGESTPAVVSEIDPRHPAMLTIDLESVQTIDRIHLHSAQVGDTLPYMFDSRFGLPRRMRIEGALKPDFSDAAILLNFHQTSPFHTGPIIMRNILPEQCRYVRLTVRKPDYPDTAVQRGSRFGFAEVELFSGAENVALHKPVAASFKLGYFARTTAPLTDGSNLYGRILPVRKWLNELALRHALETERPLVAEELGRRYARQKTQLTWSIRVAVLLAAAIIIGVFINRIARQRAIYHTRERMAADIHDELGANLHAIGLLGTLARKLKDSPEEQDDILVRLQEMTRRTGLAARCCANTHESRELHEDIVGDMRRTTERLVADLDHNVSFEGEDLLCQLKLRRRIDLFLFYQECLTNVIRHSGATRVATRVQMTPGQLSLTVTDNGCGTNRNGEGKAPQSLRRRARFLRAKVSATTPEGGGTCIQLTRSIRKRDLRNGGSA